MRKDGDSLVQQALIIGKNRNYWHVMRRRSGGKYEYIYSLAGIDLVEGYRIYMVELDKVLDRFSAAYSDIEYMRLVSVFAREHGYNKTSLSHTGSRSIKGIKTHKTFMKIKKMIPEMEEFIRRRSRE